MSIYGNLIKESLDILEESLIISIDESNDELKSFMKNWQTSNNSLKRKQFKNEKLSEEDYDYLIELYKTMRTTEKYSEYKDAFDKLCKYCHIVPDGTIITKCNIKSGSKKNCNSIYVEYTENTKKLKLPSGVKLYHMSRVKGIKELMPFFRGKSAKGFMYDKPRIYLTAEKNMPKALADYTLNEKMYKYEVKTNITDIYVDPLIPNKLMKALYIETDKPIPVKQIN